MEPPPLHHGEPLRVPEVRPEPPRTVARGRETRRRVLPELHPPADPAGRLLPALLRCCRRPRPVSAAGAQSLPLPAAALGGPVAGRPPPLAAADPEVVVQPGGDDRVEGFELGSSGLRELLNV